MPACSVFTCKNVSAKFNVHNSGISYHSFPGDINIRIKWVAATGQPPSWIPKKSSCICSRHFTNDCYKLGKKNRRIYENAIPTLDLCYHAHEKSECSIGGGILSEETGTTLGKKRHFDKMNEEPEPVPLSKRARTLSLSEETDTTLKNKRLVNETHEESERSNESVGIILSKEMGTMLGKKIHFDKMNEKPEPVPLSKRARILSLSEETDTTLKSKRLVDETHEESGRSDESVGITLAEEMGTILGKKRHFDKMNEELEPVPLSKKARMLSFSEETDTTLENKRLVDETYEELESCNKTVSEEAWITPRRKILLYETNKESDTKRHNCSSKELDITPRKRRLFDVIDKKNRKIRSLQARNRRLKKKLKSMETLLKHLQMRNLINEDNKFILESVDIKIQQLLRRTTSASKSGRIPRTKYSPELRTFALTLAFYSMKAYKYVRKTFSTCLPSPKTLTSWYSKIGAMPGFTKEAFNAIKIKSEGKNVACTLVLDEMKIKENTEWHVKSQRNFGYVDFGTGVNVSDNTQKATEALVFLLVAINGSWKVPISFFLVHGVSGEQKAILVKQAIDLSRDAGVRIKAITFDGHQSNLSMARSLGCSFDPHDLHTSFCHPSTSEEPIHIFLDPCHMIKLIRNCLENYGEFDNGCGGKIKWFYFKRLHELQENERFHLGNKLRADHIYFKSKIMRVKLASQIFSNSVADSLTFLETELKVKEFENVSATVQFVKMINDLFDVLDSKARSHGLKRAINIQNYFDIFNRLDEFKSQLLKLSASFLNSKRQLKHDVLIKSPRYTGFLGLCVCIESTKKLFSDLVLANGSFLKYLPMHRISQDHIELLFFKIRSYGGNSDNPTPREFEAIYKKLLIHTELVESKSSNCVPLENITILDCSSAVERINKTTPMANAVNHLEEVFEEELVDEIQNIEEALHLSPFGEKVVEYIAGFVVHCLIKSIKCETCVGALIAPEVNKESLIFAKDRGRLFYPSQDVLQICKNNEKILKAGYENEVSLNPKYTPQFIISRSMKWFIGKDVFKNIEFHQFETENANHIIDLMKAIMQKYLDTRIAYLRKDRDPKNLKRQILHKLVHNLSQ